jgi:protein-S-isoprenylcysteine O-methyltransferase Ste14
MNPIPLWLRAVVAFILLPGITAGLIPWLLARWSGGSAGSPLGWVPLAVGVLLLIQGVAAFYRRGRGTLAPWDPPRRLVTEGLYRLTRNPMYLGVLGVVSGWALVSGSRPLAWYTIGLAVAFHLRVRFFEEPQLARAFGSEWQEYQDRVPRWLLRWP